MRDERRDHTLQATALVHEAYARLVGAEVEWSDKAHFFRVAGRAMRRALVDHARARRTAKRGGDLARVTLVEAQIESGERQPDILALDAALETLAERDARKARVIELHFFVGLSYEEVARVLEISPVTVHRDMTFARAWLKSALAGEQRDGG